jgi:hypothetical protein
MKRWIPHALVALLAAAPLAAFSQSGQAPGPQAARALTSPAGPKPLPDAAVLAERKREAERRRLFRSDEPLELTLTADFRAVMRDRNPKSVKTFPATITFAAADGSAKTIPLQIRTRGHSRRNPRTCTFAPLRLEFDKATVKGTVFDGHGPLKLGTHCRGGAEEVVLREYAIYRMYNLLTPYSFRARMARMTYVDAATGKQVAAEAGIFLEDDDDVAKRMEGRIIAMAGAMFARLEQQSLSQMMLFQYMIGNTDFSIIAQHNVRIVETPAIRRYAVPYDFDYSGLADSGYGVPANVLPITSVRDRLYRGPCRTAVEWQPHVEKMREAKPELLGVLDSVPGLRESYRRSAKNYLEQFYKSMSQPSVLKRELIDNCAKVGM